VYDLQPAKVSEIVAASYRQIKGDYGEEEGRGEKVMGKAPAFQMYAADFYMDTNGWSIDEVGIYTRLLFDQWVNGFIPSDPERLARTAQCSLKKFLAGWEIIQKKFIPAGEGQLKNPRLEEERNKQEVSKEKLSISGRSGGLKTQEKRRQQSSEASSEASSQGPSEIKALQSSSSSSLNTKDIYMPFFEDFWKAYPKRNGKTVGRKECLDYFKTLKPDLYPNILEAVQNYANSEVSKNGYAKDPIRFLKKDFWCDWLEPENKGSTVMTEKVIIPFEEKGDPWAKEMKLYKEGKLK
jgi:uncharacterized protein YdaU (DUF1376 family)